MLFLQRQGVLHGVGFAFCLEDMHLRFPFGLLDLLHLGRFCLQFRDLHLFLLELGLDAHAIVFLLLQQERLQPFGVLLRQVNVAQHNFLHDDPIGSEFLRDHSSRALSYLFAFCRKHVPNCVVRNQLTPDACHYRRDDLFLDRMRQIALNVVQPLGIQAIPYGDGQSQRESFFCLDVQQLRFTRDVFGCDLSIFCDTSGEHLIPRVKQGHLFD